MANVVQITRGCEYAIAAMRWIAAQPNNEALPSDRVAEGAGIPQQFAANILTQLAKAAILKPHRGARRGYTLARPAAEITLVEIIEAYDGPFEKPWCFLDRERACSVGEPCVLHETWSVLRDVVRERLARVSLEEIARGIG